jgi:hypothetical protein
MNLNNIQLKTHMLADLYRDSLVETSTTSVPDSSRINYLGNNQKNILVIVTHTSVPYLPDNELSFLTNVLAACKLSLADIGIINHAGAAIASLQDVVNAEANTVLLFGVQPLSIGLPINFPAFQLQPFNKRTYLYAPGLSEIEADKALKTKLWSSLKALFGI